MTHSLSSTEARNTKIFVIENGQVVETTLFDHVCESAEETTSPRGVMHKLFVEEKTGILYKCGDTGRTITELTYDELDEEAQGNFSIEGQGIIAWELRKWEANGRVRIIDTYETEQEANDEWYTRTYNYDFLPDDQRDTQYWNTREEAEAELEERKNEQ